MTLKISADSLYLSTRQTQRQQGAEMARILIYDSDATVDDAGQAVEMTMDGNFKPSSPMRLHGGPKGDQRNVSYEFVISSELGLSIDLEWYQAFFNDHPMVNLPLSLPLNFRQQATPGINPKPGGRIFPGSSGEYPWAREQIAIAGAAGAIDHYDITRAIASAGGVAEPSADCRYYPMLVHALWCQVQVRPTSAAPWPRVRIFAHGGGLDNIASYTERQLLPFSWAVQGGADE